MSVEQSTKNEDTGKTFALIKHQSWDEIKETIKGDSIRSDVVVVHPLDAWFDMTNGYPLKACEWFERQIANGAAISDLMFYSQYLMKVEDHGTKATFRHLYRPVSLHLWCRDKDPEDIVIRVIFQGGFEAFGDSTIFTINNQDGRPVERFFPIPDEVDENGCKKWYRQMKEVTKTLKFDPPTK